MVVATMNDKYLEDEDVVHFKIESKFGVNGEIMLPLSLVEDLKEHMNAFDGVVKYPLNTVILSAFCTYMDYINAELIPFESVTYSIVKPSFKIAVYFVTLI